MITVRLICHVERCPQNDHDDLAGNRLLGFSLNLTAGFDANDLPADNTQSLEDAIKAFLRTWHWQWDAGDPLAPQFRVAAINAGTNTLLRVTPIAGAGYSLGAAERQAWDDLLDRRLDQVKGHQWIQFNFVWPRPVQTPGADPNRIVYNGDNPEVLYGSATQRSVRHWAAELTQISVEPAPLPQAAQLVRHFWLNETDLPAGFDQVIAAPVFSFPGDAQPREPQWNEPPGPIGLGPVRNSALADLEWDYIQPVDPVTGVAVEPKIVAYLKQCPVPVSDLWKTANPLVPGQQAGDWHGGWVQLKSAIYSEDWLAELEERAAELWDLSGLIIRFASTLSRADRTLALEALGPAATAALRDLVQVGTSAGSRFLPGAPASNGAALLTEITLAGEILREIARQERKLNGGTFDPAFLRVADQVLAELDGWEKTGAATGRTVEDWWREKLTAIAPDPNGQEAPEDEAFYRVLRARHAYVCQDEHALALILAQWDVVLGSLPVDHDAAVWWRDHRELVRTKVLPVLALRRRQAAMHLGVQWTRIVNAIGREPDRCRSVEEFGTLLQTKVGECLSDYLRNRSGDGTLPIFFTDLPKPPAVPPTFNHWHGQFGNWLAGFLHELVTEKILGGAAPADELDPALRPDALVFHVADIAGGDAGSATDPMRGVSGFGLILREDVQQWAPQCVTLADVYLEATPSSVTPGKGIVGTPIGTTVIPVRASHRNGLRRALISYNNEPICAESPSLHLAQQHPMEDNSAFGSNGTGIRLRNPYKRTGQHQLIGVRFGASYRAAAFLVGIGGTLPEPIADPADRTRYIPPVEDDARVPWSDPFIYRRRVAPGPLRLSSGQRKNLPDKMGDKLDLPAIPSTVHPLARSLSELAGQTAAAALDSAREAAGLASVEDLADDDRDEVLEAALGESTEELLQALILLRPPQDPATGLTWETIAKREFRFQIQRPAADLIVWDRSFLFRNPELEMPPLDNLSERSRVQRSDVWRESFALARDNRGAPAGTDVTLDDPSVTAFRARYTRIFPPPKPGERIPQTTRLISFSRPVSEGQNGLEGERSPVCEVVITSLGSEDKLTLNGAVLAPGVADPDLPAGTLEPDLSRLRIKVKEGEVWVLELASLIPVDPFGPCFQEKLWNVTFESWMDGGVEYRVAAPRRFLVEVATALLPEPSDLLRSLRARAVAGGRLGPQREIWPEGETLVWSEPEKIETLRAGWRAEAALDPLTITGEERAGQRAAFLWIHRVTLLMQRWRWNGRPLHDAPKANSALGSSERDWTPEAFFQAWTDDDDEKLQAWDGRMFGDRAVTDYRRHDAVVDFAAGRGLAEGAARVFHQDISQDAGALYFRYAVQVRSRYEGLLRHSPVESRAGLRNEKKKADRVPEAWRRLVVPCRFDRKLPPPRVKLVLPLTDVRRAESEGGEPSRALEATPGLLVVLSEPWFCYGGLAETLKAEAMIAEEPVHFAENPPPQPSRRAEFGADPIVSAEADHAIVVPPGESHPDAYRFRPLEVYGPIGHTFDTDTLAPSFVHTSFILPAPILEPAIPSNDETAIDPEAASPPVWKNLSWYFLKLRFRRTLEVSGLALPLAVVESDATSGIWVQFLPPSSQFTRADRPADASAQSIEDLKLVSVPSTPSVRWQLVVKADPDTPVPLTATIVRGSTPADQTRFQLWALVTEPLFDAYGRFTQERFLDFCPIDAGVLKPHSLVETSDPNRSPLDFARRRRVRVVEMQILPGQDDFLRSRKNAAEVCEWLFPDNATETEARARCVRVSNAIDES